MSLENKLKNYKSDKPCVVCKESRDGSVTFHHLTTRAAGGEDEQSNLISLCQKHHTEIHQIGTVKFSRKYQEVKMWLEDNGWELTDCTGIVKWRMG